MICDMTERLLTFFCTFKLVFLFLYSYVGIRFLKSLWNDGRTLSIPQSDLYSFMHLGIFSLTILYQRGLRWFSLFQCDCEIFIGKVISENRNLWSHIIRLNFIRALIWWARFLKCHFCFRKTIALSIMTLYLSSLSCFKYFTYEYLSNSLWYT